MYRTYINLNIKYYIERYCEAIETQNSAFNVNRTNAIIYNKLARKFRKYSLNSFTKF